MGPQTPEARVSEREQPKFRETGRVSSGMSLLEGNMSTTGFIVRWFDGKNTIHTRSSSIKIVSDTGSFGDWLLHSSDRLSGKDPATAFRNYTVAQTSFLALPVEKQEVITETVAHNPIALFNPFLKRYAPLFEEDRLAAEFKQREDILQKAA